MSLAKKTAFNFSFLLEQDLRWGDMDAFNHINNTVYFRYFEDVRIKFFEDTGITQTMQDSQIGPILAHTECNFLLPLAFPDRIQIGTRLRDVAEKKFMMEYGVFSAHKQKLVATGTGLIVYYDYNKQQSCPIPEEIRQAITPFQETAE